MNIKTVESIAHRPLSRDVSAQVVSLCERARELEETGKYEDARQILTDFWQRIGDRPKIEGLDALAQAELLLRTGSLSGWLGSARQIPGAQEIAKDLISESAGLFSQLGQPERLAEARVDLGICYWREGALDEARITFDTALHDLGELESPQRLRAILNRAIVDQVSSRPKEALKLLSESERLFETGASRALKGKFHNEYGTVLKNTGLAEGREDYIDRALMQYTAASVELEEAGNERALAFVENNLGFLFAHLGKFDNAHEHLNRALSIANRLNDKGYRAQVEDTRARAYLNQGLLDHAEKSAASAVKGFREGDEQSNLATALTTHATTLARKGSYTEALSDLNEAVAVAAQVGDPESLGLAALTIAEELGPTLTPTEVLKHYRQAESALHHTQHLAIRARLGECARKLLSIESLSRAPAEAMAQSVTANGSLEEQVLHYEAELIRRALQASEGSVTRAARLLGVTHQGLAFILNGRQKSLLGARKPAKKRRRSIIRYH